jgi:amino acid transporter
VALLASLLGFIALYVNVPAGSTTLGRLTREAVVAFGAIWAYPNLSLSADDFTALATIAICLTWVAYAVGIAAIQAARRRDAISPPRRWRSSSASPRR